MAEFCAQCSDELFSMPSDFKGLSTVEDTENNLFPIVLCEDCGPIQVDHEGNCISYDCGKRHGEMRGSLHGTW